MSRAVTKDVWASERVKGPTELVVMLALADYAKDDGKCWPGIASLARNCRMTERGVRKVLDRLEGRGLIKRDSGRGGHKKTAHYVVTPKGGPVQPSLFPGKNPEHGSPFDDRKTLNDVPKTLNDVPNNPERGSENPERRSGEPVKNQSRNQSRNRTSRAREPKTQNRFQEFWDRYPHRHGAKKGRKQSEQKYAAAIKNGATETEIIDAATRYANDRGVMDGYAKNPATWLHQHCWLDDIELPAPAARSEARLKPSQRQLRTMQTIKAGEELKEQYRREEEKQSCPRIAKN